MFAAMIALDGPRIPVCAPVREISLDRDVIARLQVDKSRRPVVGRTQAAESIVVEIDLSRVPPGANRRSNQ